MAAKKRDFLDEIIDIKSDWNALSHRGDEIIDSFTSEAEDLPLFDPEEYKERPRVNSTYCMTAVTKNEAACRRCMDACPVDAITIEGTVVRVGDTCIRCGLCVSLCPTEAFVVRSNATLALYDKIARAATAYEQCYLTCPRALNRFPKENEIVLPCVGAVSREVWFDLLCDYPNLSVYLPLGVCDECEVVTGEIAFSDIIADAEEWSGESVGLEVDESDLTHEHSRAYKRSQFVSSMTTAGTRLVTRGNPALAGAQAVAKRLQNHSLQITELQEKLEEATGKKTAQNKYRMLTRKRRLVMAALQKYPDLAEEMFLEFPVVDSSACTMCGECTKACTVSALEMDASGRVSVEPSYCVNCGACAVLCPEGAITMRAQSVEDLVVPDPKAEERKRKAQMKDEGKKTIKRGLDLLESLDDE